jgi:dGTP triphosphohydrolase
MLVTVAGCRRTSSQEPTKKTPNQILWQIRDHIKQVAKDVKDAKDKQLINEDKYKELQVHVEEASKQYNHLKAHYALWKELDDTYRHKVTVTVLFVTTALKGGV